MPRSVRWIIATAVLFPSMLALVSRVSAVPMWSRRYEVPCTMCHSFPSLQLTGRGIDFLRRGHRMEDDKPDKNFANLLSAHGEWNYSVVKKAETAFPPPEMHLHAGGALSSLFSAYADANVNSDFEVIYAQFTKAFGSGNYVTARQGKISPTVVRNYGNGLMASASTPLIVSDATLGQNPFTPARDSYGADLGGRWRILFVQAGVVNGEDIPGQVTVGTHKDLFATVEANLPDDPTGVGVYYYRGGYDLADSTGATSFDRYDRTAVFGNLTRDRCRLAGAYLRGTDNLSASPKRTISGYYVQADGYVSARVTPFVRYDWTKAELKPGEDKTEAISLGLALPLYVTDAAGGRAVVELSRRKENDQTIDIGRINLLWSF